MVEGGAAVVVVVDGGEDVVVVVEGAPVDVVTGVVDTVVEGLGPLEVLVDDPDPISDVVVDSTTVLPGRHRGRHDRIFIGAGRRGRRRQLKRPAVAAG